MPDRFSSIGHRDRVEHADRWRHRSARLANALMATQRVRCRACGFGALLFSTAEGTWLTVDSAAQRRACKHLGDHPRTNAENAGPLDCRDFHIAFVRLGKGDDASSSISDGIQGETVGGTTVVAEPASNTDAETSPCDPDSEAAAAEQTVAGTVEGKLSERARRPKPAEVASPKPKKKAKAAPRSARKKTRKIHSDIAISADQEPRVS